MADEQPPTAGELPDNDRDVVRSLAPRAMPDRFGSWRHAPRMYLDQLHWVRLARGRNGQDDEATRLLDTIERLLAEERVVVPLAGAHWAETWHRGDWQSRWRLAKVMWDVSRLASFSPFHEIVEREIDLELHRWFGRPAWPAPAEPLGVGVNHAFASQHGRLRYVEWLDGEGAEGPPVTPPEIIATLPPHIYEWVSLAGIPDDMTMAGLDLAEAQRAGTRWSAWETHVAGGLGRLHRQERTKMVAFSLFEALWRTVLDRCGSVGLIPEIAIGRGLEPVRRFVAALPAADCLTELRVLKHQNPQQKWARNDRIDLLALSVAIPYSQVVVTERQWAHMVRRARLDTKYGVFVTGSLAEGIEALSSLS